MRTLRENPLNDWLPPFVIDPATFAHAPLRVRFWIAHCAPARPGRIVPLKRIERPRLTRVALTLVLTLTATPSVRIGDGTSRPSVETTRYCVVAGTLSSGNAKLPLAS